MDVTMLMTKKGNNHIKFSIIYESNTHAQKMEYVKSKGSKYLRNMEKSNKSILCSIMKLVQSWRSILHHEKRKKKLNKGVFSRIYLDLHEIYVHYRTWLMTMYIFLNFVLLVYLCQRWIRCYWKQWSWYRSTEGRFFTHA